MASEPTAGTEHPWARRGYVAAACLALLVTLVFVFVGDGVDVPEAEGPRAFVVDVGHALAWALLTVAFAVAAFRGGWTRVSNAAAVGAGIAYGLFLFAVLIWP